MADNLQTTFRNTFCEWIYYHTLIHITQTNSETIAWANEYQFIDAYSWWHQSYYTQPNAQQAH